MTPMGLELHIAIPITITSIALENMPAEYMNLGNIRIYQEY